jgi:hypothetical protein
MMLYSRCARGSSTASILDFYESPWKDKWAKDGKIKTPQGEVTVTVPGADEEVEQPKAVPSASAHADVRQSFHIQAKLVRIGAIMGFKIWLPRADRSRVGELLNGTDRAAILHIDQLNGI